MSIFRSGPLPQITVELGLEDGLGWVTGRISLMSKITVLALIARKSSLGSVRDVSRARKRAGCERERGGGWCTV